MGTNFNYDDTDHQGIFDRINGGAGSDSLQQVSQAWQRLGDDVGATGKSYVQSSIRGILTSRDGAAAQAAAVATGAMLPWMDDVAMIATTAAQRVQGQADYWATAKNKIPPVPPAPVSAGFLGNPTEWFAQKMDWFPGLTTEEEKAQQRQQDAAEQARQAMRVYQSSSNGNIDQPPAFTPPQALDNTIGSLPLTSPRVDGAGAAPPAVGGGGPVGYATAPAQQAVAHQAVAHQSAAYQAGYQPVSTTSQLAEGGLAGPGSDAPGSGRGSGYSTPGQGGNPGPIPVGTGSGAGTARQDPRPAPARGAPPPRPGTGSGGGAGGRGRGAGHTGFGSGPGSPGLGSQPSAGFGPRPTVSAHPSTEGMGGARSGAVSASTAGGVRGGESFAGGAGQRGEQDREHRNKYLVHDDSNSIVGDLPPTAPPVIGADPDY